MRSRTMAAVAAGLTAVPAVPAVLPEEASAGSGQDALEAAIVERVNNVRGQHGLAPVSSSGALAAAASRQSRRCLRRGAMSHAGLSSRVRRYTRAKTVGETLAWVSGGGGRASKVVGMWMRSAPHRAQLLSSRYRRIGVGERSGRMNGRRGTMVTANFATG